MNIYPIDIPKSKVNDSLVIKKPLFIIISDLLVEIPIVLFIPFVCGFGLYKKVSNGEPYVSILILFIIILIFSGFIIYSMTKLNYLLRINGISTNLNLQIINEIVESNKWKINSKNQQITIINFSWKETGTDWGKQMTILYDKKDILVNCTSYGLFSTPSPYHWFANRKKMNKLKSEFNHRIKNAPQHRL